ncbi:thiamine pyrophosphate-dependent enzyme, partial [Acinetobacter baumannii]|uniref:thiamine pyrophosphate-dependent enzyme n=1 Tax=Acinetobacter baumannii TaxID=470 RepID=UPI001FF04049
LVTALQYNKKINILLFDNSGYGCINNLQMSNGSGSFFTELMNHETKEIMHIDYATIGRGYGLKTYKVTTQEELAFAIEDSKKQTVSTLIDIKVLPKTMTDGYDAWWHVGVAEESKETAIKNAFESKEENLKEAKQY